MALDEIPPPPRRGRPAPPTDKHPPLPPSPPPLGPPPDPLANEPADLGRDEPVASDVLEYRRLLSEQMSRQIEALRLYEPLPIQAEFHANHARVRLLRGSNRSGKTLSCAVELARAVTTKDPHGKYPDVDGRAYIVGKDEKHLGEVIYRKLFRAGAFKIIRDEHTGLWRLYHPWNARDRIRMKEAKKAPPLIPSRFVKAVAWNNKAANIPQKVTLTTGWEIDFWSSLSKPPRGSDLDLVWFDEEIIDSEWYPEMSSRLLDRAGVMFWGATPQTGSDRLFELHNRCEAEWEDFERAGKPNGKEPSAREWLILLADNPHIDEQQKIEHAKDLSDEEIEVRIHGGFAIEASKVYPEFSPRIHGTQYFDIPHAWCRYAVIDPGRQVCAVLFAAVPPPATQIQIGETTGGQPITLIFDGDQDLVLYDELYIRSCDAVTFGERMAAKCIGQEFEAFIIDRHGGRISDIGSGRTVEEQYAAALESRGVKSHRTGSGFLWGSDDVQGRTESVRALLKVRRDGHPSLKVVAINDRLPNFKWEIERYRYKRDKTGTLDVPEDRGRVHLMACLGYLCAYAPKYVAPKLTKGAVSGAFRAFKDRLARMQKKAGTSAGRNFGPARPK